MPRGRGRKQGRKEADRGSEEAVWMGCRRCWRWLAGIVQPTRGWGWRSVGRKLHTTAWFSLLLLCLLLRLRFVLDLDVAAPGWTRPMQGPERSAVLHEKLPLSALEVGGLNRAEPAVCRLLSIPSELI